MRSGFAIYNTYRTRPVQTLGRAGTDSGRAAGPDVLAALAGRDGVLEAICQLVRVKISYGKSNFD